MNYNDFKKFSNNLNTEYDFIKKLNQISYLDDNNIARCIKVTCIEASYSIVFYTAGYNYPRYASVVYRTHRTLF